MKKVLHIEGMMCRHCKANVENVLSAVAGVETAVADLASKTAVVTLKAGAAVSDAALVTAVTDADYTVTSIE